MRYNGFKYFKSIGLILCFLFVIPFPIHAEENNQPNNQTPASFTLDQLIQLARQHNLQMKIANLDQKIAVESYKDSRALPNPDFEYSTGRGTPGDSPDKPRLWDFGFKWSMPNPIYRYFLMKSLKADVTAAEIQSEINSREVIRDLKIHFYKLLLVMKLKSAAEERVRILTEIEHITKAKVEIGEMKEIDALRASVETQKNHAALFRLEKTITSERNALNEFMNFTLPENFTIQGDLDIHLNPDLDARLRQSISDSPILRLNLSQLKKGGAQLNAARSSIIESIEVFTERAKEIDGKLWKVGVGISIPLFNQKSAAVRAAQLQKQKAETALSQAIKHLSAEIDRITGELRSLEKEIEIFKNAVLDEGGKNRELTEKLYKEGEVPLVVFLDAQTNFFDIQERYYNAITEWNILTAERDAILGGHE
ncbi:MAG: TolC family protein [Candidatus Omnitrophota bacterium]